MKRNLQRADEVRQMMWMCERADVDVPERLLHTMHLYELGRIGLGQLADTLMLEADASRRAEWTGVFAYARDMPLEPHCPKPEWMDRAGRRLMALQPNLNAVDVARILVEHLWEEACDLSPEEAAEVYVSGSKNE